MSDTKICRRQDGCTDQWKCSSARVGDCGAQNEVIPARSDMLDAERALPDDARGAFELYMSNRGEAVRYAGDGMYEYRSINDQSDAFKAGAEWAMQQAERLDERFIADLARSRAKYPGIARMFDGLMGEVDELRRAYNGDGDRTAEAFDVAVVAYRIATEGDTGGNVRLAERAPSGEGEALAREFHELYERLAPSFGYETRIETREFDPASKNGKLMVAVCSEISARRATAGTTAAPSECKGCDPAEGFCKACREAERATAGNAAPTEAPAKQSRHRITSWSGKEITPADLVVSLNTYGKCMPGAGRAQWAMREAAAYIASHAATAAPGDLSKLIRYEPWDLHGSEMEAVENGDYVKFADVQALLVGSATPGKIGIGFRVILEVERVGAERKAP